MLIVHGLNDELRPWEEVKKSYNKGIGEEKVVLIQNMKHEMNNLEVRELFASFILSKL